MGFNKLNNLKKGNVHVTPFPKCPACDNPMTPDDRTQIRVLDMGTYRQPRRVHVSCSTERVS